MNMSEKYMITEEQIKEIKALVRSALSLIRERRINEARHKLIKIDTVTMNVKRIEA